MAANGMRDDDVRRGFSYSNAVAITPSDSTLIDPCPVEAIFCGEAGTVTILTAGGQAVQHTVAAGQILWVRTQRVNATGTSPLTSLVGWY